MYAYNHYIIIYAHVHLSNWSIIYIEHLEPTAYWPSETEAQDIASHSQPAHAEGELIICCPWNALPFEHLFYWYKGLRGGGSLITFIWNFDSPWLLFATFWPTGQIDSGILHLLAASCQHQQENSTSTSRCSCSCAEAPRKAFGVRPKASLPLWSKHGDESIWWPPFGVHVEGFHSTVHRASSRLSVDGFQLLFSFNLLKLLRKYASGNHGIIESHWTLQMSGSQVNITNSPTPLLTHPLNHPPRPPPIWPVAPAPWAVHWAPPGPLPARARRAPRRSRPWRWVPVPTRPPTSAWDGKIGKWEKIGKNRETAGTPIFFAVSED